MEWGQQMRRHEQVARDATYHNSNYTNSRETKIPLIIDIEESLSQLFGLSNAASFSVDLMEPLIIDDLSDIYLDGCMTMNSNFTHKSDDMAFVVKIDQFNNNTRSASTNDNQRLNNALLISNEHNNFLNHNEMVLHKGKKMNYVCSINPTKFSQFTGTITNLAGDPIFPKQKQYIKLNADATKAIAVGTAITIGAHGDFRATVAVAVDIGARHIYFYESVNGSAVHSGTLAYIFAGLFTGTAVENSHIEGHYPRIMLEFLICNRK